MYSTLLQFPFAEAGPPGPLAPAPPPLGPSAVRLWLLPSPFLGTERNPPRKLRVSSRKLRVSKLTPGRGRGGRGGPGGGARGPGGGVVERPSPWGTHGPRPVAWAWPTSGSTSNGTTG